MIAAAIPESARLLIADLHTRCVFDESGADVDVAVSGGADSSALLVLAIASGSRVTAHHVDHGLRIGSANEAQIVADLAERFGAQFESHTAHVGAGPNLEARARHARFGVLPLGTATGHTLDDRVETTLMNLMRGASRTGLSSMRASPRHPIVRLRSSETRALCRALDIDAFEDPSNQDLAILRNRVRQQLLPLMAEMSNRDVALTIDRQSDLLADEDELLDELSLDIDPTDAIAVAGAHPALGRRVVRRLISHAVAGAHPPSAAVVERVLRVARGEVVACEIEGGYRVQRSSQRLMVVAPSVL